MEELLRTFTIPDNTKMEERSIVVDGGAIIGNYCDIGFGIIADSVIAGERVRIDGNVIGPQEIRIDMWSHVGGDVRTKNQAFIGEFVDIDGKLVVGGDLDIGKDVKIGGGFEAKGWIVVRNPIPVIIYIYLYLTEMLRLGKGEEVEKALSELFSDDDDDLYEGKLLIIPSGSKVDMETIRVPDRANIGSGCRLMGNIRAASLVMGNNNTLFGSIKTMDDIVIGEGNTIHGNLVTRGNVRVGKGTHILGEINGGVVTVHEDAKVDGPMRAPGGVTISRFEIEKEPRMSGILDLVPQPAAKKKPKVELFEIPEKRMNTAIRLSAGETRTAAKPKTTSSGTTGIKVSAGSSKTKKAITKAKIAAEIETASEGARPDEVIPAEKTVPQKGPSGKKTAGTKAAAKTKKASVGNTKGKRTTTKKKATTGQTAAKDKTAKKTGAKSTNKTAPPKTVKKTVPKTAPKK
ncbi:MAG: hypothetical protein M8352_03290 [ANME-2 cluster archaeon]|nr:hypothetical protein [ANME-2 cluster archaeon]